MWLIVTICLSATFQRYGPLKLAKNDHVLFFAGGPDALDDLKFVSGDFGFDLQGHP